MIQIGQCFQHGFELCIKLAVSCVEGFPKSMLPLTTRGPTYNEVPVLPLHVLQEFRSWTEAIILLNYHPTFEKEGSGHMNNAKLVGKHLCPQADQFPHASLSTCVAGLPKKPIISEDFCFAVRQVC